MKIVISPQLKQLAANRNTSLRWYHSLGIAVNKAMSQIRGPVARAIRQIAREVFKDMKMVSTLYICRRFAKSYAEDELTQLDGLCWKQIQYLISVKDKRLRNQLIHRLKAGTLVTRKLVLEIQERLGKRTHGGRKPRQLQLAHKAACRESTRLCKELVRCIPDWLRNVDITQTNHNDPERDLLVATTRESLQAAAQMLHEELRRLQPRPR